MQKTWYCMTGNTLKEFSRNNNQFCVFDRDIDSQIHHIGLVFISLQSVVYNNLKVVELHMLFLDICKKANFVFSKSH